MKKDILFIALFGKAGTGKDFLLKSLKNENLKNVSYKIGCTTRPMREGEVDGVDYHFLSEEEFLKEEKEGSFVEVQKFNGWYYGTRLADLQPYPIMNIGVSNISGIQQMEKAGIRVSPVQIISSDKTRLLRQLEREECPDVKEIIRRFNTDEEDFKEVPFEYFYLSNYKDDENEAPSKMKGFIGTLTELVNFTT